jgi:DNA-binding PadR family transcriptional regulator
MSLPHAILGLLNYQAMTGYDLKRKWFDRSLRFFWPADQAQIYRTLDSLVDRDWATFEIEPGGDRPNRKVYALTAAGRAELDRWLTTPLPMPAVRDPLMVQLFSAAHIADSDIIHLLRARRADRLARLTEYEVIRERLPSFGTGKRLKLWQIVVGTGIATETAAIAWLDEVIAGFDVQDDGAPEHASSPASD